MHHQPIEPYQQQPQYSGRQNTYPSQQKVVQEHQPQPEFFGQAGSPIVSQKFELNEMQRANDSDEGLRVMQEEHFYRQQRAM